MLSSSSVAADVILSRQRFKILASVGDNTPTSTLLPGFFFIFLRALDTSGPRPLRVTLSHQDIFELTC